MRNDKQKVQIEYNSPYMIYNNVELGSGRYEYGYKLDKNRETCLDSYSCR